MMDLLQKAGLNSYESKVYLALLEYGRLDAKSISDKSLVPPTAVYPNLKSLLQKGLIQKFDGEVSYFEALNPATAIQAYVEQQKKDLSSLQENLIHSSQELFHRKQISPEKEVLNVSLGKEASSAIYQETILQAKKSYYILGWRMDKPKYYRFLNEFRQAVKKGVDIRILVVGKEEKNRNLIQEYLKAGIKMRFVNLENFSILIVDEKECKITLKDKDLPQKINLHILDPSLSKAMYAYFLTVWEKGVVMK